MESLSTLMDAGFNKTTPPRLAIDCVATPINLPEVKELYQYCRENNISPQFSGLIPHGEALQRKLVVGREEYKKLYKQIKTYDKTIGYDYPEQIPFLGGFECRQIKYGMYVDIQGNVWECNAGNLKVGNIRDSKLKDLWNSTKAKEFRKSWKMGNCHVREKYWKNDKK
jgi:MoaA/NifB/PqqE/SkfB family radical SAM enzyme